MTDPVAKKSTQVGDFRFSGIFKVGDFPKKSTQVGDFAQGGGFSKEINPGGGFSGGGFSGGGFCGISFCGRMSNINRQSGRGSPGEGHRPKALAA
jgi:hypothetical protein